MTLEEEVQRLIDDSMELEVQAARSAPSLVDTVLVSLTAGMGVMREAILLVARHVDATDQV